MNSIVRCKPLLGTYVEISLQADLSDDELIEQSEFVFTEIRAVQDSMSFHDVNSELSYINRHAYRRTIAVSEGLWFVLNQVATVNAQSRGLFDPTVADQLVRNRVLPNNVGGKLSLSGRWQDVEMSQQTIRFHRPLAIDLGGIAKGYAVDQGIKAVGDNIHAVINAGGDIRMTDWQGQTITIRTSTTEFIQCSMNGPAMATSASYFNGGYSVIIDPVYNQAVNNSKTISVFASNCLMADALTKVAWLANTDNDIMRRFDATCYQH